jgi:hypothetical protein
MKITFLLPFKQREKHPDLSPCRRDQDQLHIERSPWRHNASDKIQSLSDRKVTKAKGAFTNMSLLKLIYSYAEYPEEMDKALTELEFDRFPAID